MTNNFLFLSSLVLNNFFSSCIKLMIIMILISTGSEKNSYNNIVAVIYLGRYIRYVIIIIPDFIIITYIPLTQSWSPTRKLFVYYNRILRAAPFRCSTMSLSIGMQNPNNGQCVAMIIIISRPGSTIFSNRAEI